MNYLFLIPISLAMGVVGLGAFLWSLRNGQYDDLEGAAQRILFDDDALVRRKPGTPAAPPEAAPDQPALSDPPSKQ